MPAKLGVYLCTGCDIGDAIDPARLAKVATSECKATVCRTHPALCGSEGLETIRQDVASGAAAIVVVAGCSPRFKAEAFDFNHGTVVERVNLREHVAWCHAPGDPDTQMLAEDYLRMGASAFLRWRSFESLAQAGYAANDLTDAALNPVTRFKSQFGGRLTATLSISRTDSLLYSLETTARRLKARLSERLRSAKTT